MEHENFRHGEKYAFLILIDLIRWQMAQRAIHCIDHYNKLIMHLIYRTNETAWDVTASDTQCTICPGSSEKSEVE